MDKKGFSLVSLIISLSLLALISYFGFRLIAGKEIAGKGRDGIRLSDLAIFIVAVESYFLDHNQYPDSRNVTRVSNFAAGNPVNSSGNGWIKSDLSKYLPLLKVDPLNTGKYVYKYRQDGGHYKFEAVLESEKKLMKNQFDGGINDERYEVGNGKNIYIE